MDGGLSLTRSSTNSDGPDVIELQLAHKERDKVHRACHKAQKPVERRKMMQTYADYLDGLRAGGNVVSIFGKAG